MCSRNDFLKDPVRGRLTGYFALIGAIALISAPVLAGDIRGKVRVEGMKSPDSVVVYLDSASDIKCDPPVEHAAVHQVRLSFVPHVLAVMRGTTVDFWNDDSVKHGVSWPSVGGDKKLAHHLGIWPQGEMMSFTFEQTGAIPLLCYLHPEMSGYIFVVPTSYFSVTDAEGDFVIRDVPPGEHVLKTWSEGGESVSQQLQVAELPVNVNMTVRRARAH